LHYIRSQHGKEKNLVGVDNFDKLRNIAELRLPDCQFYKGDIWTKEGLPKEKYDVVCMSGVLCLFEDFRQPLSNLMDIVDENGIIMIFSAFNSHDCHTEVHYKQKGQEGKMLLYSLQEVSEWIENKGYQHKFIPFKINTTIKEQKENPIRSYTLALADGTNGLINGIDLWLEQYLLVITQ
jgi:trans-aconitate methyltransferase